MLQPASFRMRSIRAPARPNSENSFSPAASNFSRELLVTPETDLRARREIDLLPIRYHRPTVLPGTLCLDGATQLQEGIVGAVRSEEHRLNSSHMSISYAVFCL